MDDIETKVIETITQLNDDENLGIDFPESYIEDLSKAYIKSELTDDELAELIRKLKQAYDRAHVEAGEAVGTVAAQSVVLRSEERRVGKECRSRWSPYH